MELLIFGGCVLFVLCSVARSNAQIRARGETTAAPQWVLWLFVLVCSGLLFLCLAPGIMLGLQNAGPWVP
jgi:hypothetical protein